MFIDIHSHLDFYDAEKIAAAVAEAGKAGVGLIINSGISPERIKKTIELAKKYPEIKMSLGLYPVEMLEMSEKEIEEQIKIILETHEKMKDKVLAIGEVGIDLKEKQELDKQKKNFIRFIELAKKLDLPLIIHSRKAELECVEILEKEKVGAGKVIMHCFNGKMSLVKRCAENGWCFSIPTIIKFSEHFQNLVKAVPIEQLFCETDTPFLHPDKERDNTPKNVIESYKKIAEIKGISLKEAERAIEKNFERVFG